MNSVMKPLAVAAMLIAASATTGQAWVYYAQLEGSALEEMPSGIETLAAGTIVAYLPNGAKSVIVEHIQYFISGGNWFVPIIDSDGVRYQVVFAPM